MKEPTSDDQSVDEYLDRIRDRFEEASARVLGMTGPATEAPPAALGSEPFDPQPPPPVAVEPTDRELLDRESDSGPEAEGEPVDAGPYIESPAAARHRGHRTDPRKAPAPPARIRRPQPITPAPSAAPEAAREPPEPPDRAPLATATAPWRNYLIPVGGLLFVGVVAIWALLWFRAGPEPAPPSFQARIDAAIMGDQFDDVAARLDGDTVVLVGTVTDASLAGAAADAVSAVGGVGSVDNRIVVLGEGGTVETLPVGTSSVTADVVAALSANGFRELDATVVDRVATLTGTLRSSELAARAAALVETVDGVDSVVSSVEIVPLRPADEILADAAEVVARSEFPNLVVTIAGDTATLTGVADRAGIKAGYFASIEELRARLLEVDGVGVVRARLQLKGDEALLRDQLKSLIDEQAIVFQSASAELEPESLATLDLAAEVILGQPGLRVFIAGHTDSVGSQGVNEQLSQARGDVVRNYLISVGVPPNRLFVVAYGELFPGQESADEDRRVEFEVGP